MNKRTNVDGSGDRVLVTSLQGIKHAQDFSRVAADGSRVADDDADLLGWVDNEDGADGERDALLVHVRGILLINPVWQRVSVHP